MNDSEEGDLVSARGILRCLRMLGEEARGAGMVHTARAIAEAAATAQAEVTRYGLLPADGPVSRTLN